MPERAPIPPKTATRLGEQHAWPTGNSAELVLMQPGLPPWRCCRRRDRFPKASPGGKPRTLREHQSLEVILGPREEPSIGLLSVQRHALERGLL